MRTRALFILLFVPLLLNAQEYRATLLGVVTDPTGATVPEATVTAVNMETSVRTVTKTNNDGSYVIPLLLPGRYAMQVEHPGFKTFERSPIELRLNDRTRLDVELQVGQVSDRVTVTAEAPLLETASSNRGEIVDNRKVTDLPISGRNPYVFMQLAAGAVYNGSMIWTRPFGEGSQYTINGGRNASNEFQLDGAPNNSTDSSAAVIVYVGYTPPIEATQEMKVQTNTYDSQYGRTGGGVANLSLKSGTNRFHGAVYEYMRRASLEANSFANNAAGARKVDHIVDQYGFEIDGPVMLPKLYRGKDRTFFMFALERYREPAPRPDQGAVPTAEQRRGDFSQTYTSAGGLYTIYDPLSVRLNPAFDPTKAVTLSNLQYIRTPFANNQVPQNRMEPIALNVLKDIPLPNQPGDPITHMNNWFANGAEKNSFQNLLGRIDHFINPTWRIFARGSREMRDDSLDYWVWGTVASKKYVQRRGAATGAFDATGTLNPSTVLNGRVSFTRVLQNAYNYATLDVSSLGFPKSLLSQLPMPNFYPVFTFENYLQASIGPWANEPNDTIAAQGTLLKLYRTHSMKFGSEFRVLRYAVLGRENGAGNYGFTRSWTSSNPQVTDANAGNAIASFLLGYMGSGTVTISATPYQSRHYPVVFFQDDWQVARRLSLNLGVRWDSESPLVERYNRQNRGFDFNAKSPYQIPGYDLRGGLLFAGVGGQPRGARDPDKDNIQPRFGLAYKMLESKPLVFRGGIGRYYLPISAAGGNTGFSQSTSTQTSTSDYRPFQVLSNPFPNGLVQPSGSSLGLATQVGNSISFRDVRERAPYMWQYSAGFQYELIPGLLAEATYVGSETGELQVTKNLLYLTQEQLALGTPYLSASVPNPFYGVLPVTTSRGAQATIQRRSLLAQYPQYTGVTMNGVSLGSSWYNSAAFKVERRFKSGFSLLASYTISKSLEAADYLNPQDTNLHRELTSYDRPQRLVLSGLYHFPVGPEKRWLNSGVLSHVIGGWELSWSSVTQSGTPMSYPDYYLYGDPKLKSGQTLQHWFDTSPSIWVQRPADTLRVTPLRSPNIRRHSAPQVDLTLIRDFRIKEGRKFQLKVSAFNVSNTPIFNFPNTSPASPLFGVVPTTPLNYPRSVEIGLRYAF
jgi:hypothetical protein